MTIEEGVALSRFTTIGVGGPARAFARPQTLDELEEALAWAAERDVPVATVGLGSNLLAADEGVDALVVRLEGELATAEVDGDLLIAREEERRTRSACTALGRQGWQGSSSPARSPGQPVAASG